MTTHTPGEWYVRDNYVLSSQGNTTTEICQANSHVNALMLASAPDLLAALELLIDRHDDQMLTVEEWDTARAAIAKAIGE